MWTLMCEREVTRRLSIKATLGFRRGNKVKEADGLGTAVSLVLRLFSWQEAESMFWRSCWGDRAFQLLMVALPIQNIPASSESWQGKSWGNAWLLGVLPRSGHFQLQPVGKK